MSGTIDIKSTMDTILNNDGNMPVIKESMFKRDLLPFLINRDDEKADLRMWLKIAGSWTRSIKVVDDSTGEQLFIVPPLVGSIKTEIAESGRSSINELLKTAARKSSVTEQAGREFIRQQFSDKAKANSSTFKTNVEAWNYIYTRYGFDNLVDDTFGAKATKEETSSAPLDTSTYEDL